MPQAQDPVLQSQIAEWRARCSGIGAPMTQEEFKKALTLLRAGRVSAAVSSESARRKRAKVEVPSADDLLDQMDL